MKYERNLYYNDKNLYIDACISKDAKPHVIPIDQISFVEKIGYGGKVCVRILKYTTMYGTWTTLWRSIDLNEQDGNELYNFLSPILSTEKPKEKDDKILEIHLCNGISLIYKPVTLLYHTKEQIMDMALKDLTSKLFLKTEKYRENCIVLEINEIDRLKKLNEKLVDSIYNISKKN